MSWGQRTTEHAITWLSNHGVKDAATRFSKESVRQTRLKAIKDTRAQVDAADHAKWEADKKQAEADKKPVPKEPSKPKQADKNEPYRKVLRGESTLIVYVDNAAEVQALENALANETVRGEELRLYAWVGADAVRSASRLADLGAVCIVRLGIVDWPGTMHKAGESNG